MRKDFVANASHELRTPLTVISGYLDTLAEDPASMRRCAGPMADMRRQAQRMNAIIRDLLELSRLEETDGEAAARADRCAAHARALLRKDVLAPAVHPRHVLLERRVAGRPVRRRATRSTRRSPICW